MGIIFSRSKKKPTSFQLLEQIESKISTIENFRQVTEHRQKKIVGHLILYSVALYVMSAGLFYFCFFPASLRDRLFYIIPLLLFPLIVIILKRVVTWYYRRQITSNEEKLSDLKAERKEMLENVMEKETFKVAKEILEKFAPDQLRKIMPYGTAQNSLARPPIKPTSEMQIVKRDIKSVDVVKPASVQLPSTAPLASNGGNVLQKTPLPRPVLPRDRTNVDKLVEYLIGDGPNNRYALICKMCSSHNGMALKEEFLFLAFKCCYCGYMNPARQQRLQAPRLDIKPITNIKHQIETESETESDSDIRLEEEKLYIKTLSTKHGEVESAANGDESVSESRTEEANKLEPEKKIN